MLLYLKLKITFTVPGGSDSEEFAFCAGDSGSIPGSGRSPREGKSSPLQYSGLENVMECTVHGVVKSQTRLSDFHLVTRQQEVARLMMKAHNMRKELKKIAQRRN